MSIKAVDLFCGAGGLTYGLEKSGLDVIAGYDVDPACSFPFEANNRAKFILADLEQVNSGILKNEFDGASVRVVVGCAPCQPFSTYTRGRYTDHRAWALVPTFARFVRELEPEIVAMENVPQLARHDVFCEFLQLLRTLKYNIMFHEVECLLFGIPQTRRRLTLLASKLGEVSRLEATHLPESLVTVRHAIGHEKLEPLRAGQTSQQDSLHRASRLSELNLRRIRASKPGGTWRDWPAELRATCHTRTSGQTYPAVYGRMEWDKPAPTITTQCFGYGNGRFGHPDQDRAVTLREAAILQTFPSDYIFVKPGTPICITSVGRLIGNAVPPKLGEAVGRAILCHIARYS